ncbi:hypothetical protein JTB14_016335 [Gonioctena quinquepunctata]|nr:hypothetical protein JTB14_016335 [Gonioctena quinquepunctata]
MPPLPSITFHGGDVDMKKHMEEVVASGKKDYRKNVGHSWKTPMYNQARKMLRKHLTSEEAQSFTIFQMENIWKQFIEKEDRERKVYPEHPKVWLPRHSPQTDPIKSQ